MKAFTRKKAGSRTEPESAARIALSYGVFLLLCLGLGLGLYLSSVRSARNDFWNHQGALLGNSVITTDHCLATVDSYTRHLTNDSTFIRIANMKNLNDQDTSPLADTIKRTLSSRAFTLANVPITETTST